ncbi:MAG: pilus assembly protein PilM [Candidatus Omnitrophica bacterium]|nr:pilus assembly protein PilM [Candidatus Omnitrophota bacterium]
MKIVISRFKREVESILFDLGLKAMSGISIGLDIGSEYFRASRVKGSAKDIPLKDILIKEIAYLKDIPRLMKISPDDKIAVNFTGEQLIVKRLSLPFMPVEEIEEALRWELKEQTHSDTSRLKIKFSILGETNLKDGSRKIDLIAVAYKEKSLEVKVKELKDIGLNVQAVIPTEFSLPAYVNDSGLASSDDIAAIVDIGKSSSTITIVEKQKVFFSRSIAIGGETITDAMMGVFTSVEGRMDFSKEKAENIKREQGIPEDAKVMAMMRPILERFVTQIKRSVEYYETELNSGPVNKIILAGNGARLKGLKEYISGEIGLEVSDVLPEAAESIGLCLIKKPEINLLPEKFKEKKGSKIKNLSFRMALVTFILMILSSYGLLTAESVNLKKKIMVCASHLEALRDVKDIRDEMLVFSSALNKILSGSIKAGDAMKEMSNVVPASVMLKDLLIKTDEPNIEISGVILKGEELSDFMALLEASPVFAKVQLVYSEKSEKYPPRALVFKISCNLKR